MFTMMTEIWKVFDKGSC